MRALLVSTTACRWVGGEAVADPARSVAPVELDGCTASATACPEAGGAHRPAQQTACVDQ